MKHFYLSLLSFFFLNIATAQIVNIPDANFKTKLLQSSTGNGIALGGLNQQIKIDANGDGEIQVSEAAVVYKLNVTAGNITSLEGIQSFSNIAQLICANNQLTTLDLHGMDDLEWINCSNNHLASLDITGITLQTLDVSSNFLTSLDLSDVFYLRDLYCQSNLLTSLDLSGPSIYMLRLYCQSNPLTSLDLSPTTYMIRMNCGNTLLTSLDLTPVDDLIELDISGSQISSIDLTPTAATLGSFKCANTPMASLDLSMVDISELDCSNTYINELDVSNQPTMYNLNCSGNPDLSILNIKNGSTENNQLDFSGCPNLQLICADEIQLDAVGDKIVEYGYTNCQLNTFCSFTPVGNYYEIQGHIRYDSNSNGCNTSDITVPFVHYNMTTPGFSGTYFGGASGGYNYYVTPGVTTMTPVLETPAYFNISPSTFSANFPTSSNPLVQNYCLTANGTHDDLAIVIIPINGARPGFDAKYKIIYRNKGTTTQNGSVTLQFEDDKMNFISATPIVNSSATNSKTWNFSNLKPFEKREITVIFHLNTPTDTPPLTAGAILNFLASVNGAVDAFSFDNTKGIKQLVFNSHDPNDKTCIEGPSVSPSTAGEYVHYVIRFENTGTASAVNIVVTDNIDPVKFDVSTLIPLSGSHAFTTRITGNKAEFLFQNINLPFDDVNNDGYVAFMIKTRPTLVEGDTFSNSANIYFDYNLPIVTNTYSTFLGTLGISNPSASNVISIYPNPVKDYVYFDTGSNITKVVVYDLGGRIVCSLSVNGNKVDVNHLATGTYIVKAYSDEDTSIVKMIKE